MRLRRILVAAGFAAASLAIGLGGTAAADDDGFVVHSTFNPPPMCAAADGSGVLAMINPSADHCGAMSD